MSYMYGNLRNCSQPKVIFITSTFPLETIEIVNPKLNCFCGIKLIQFPYMLE